jgi:hypothetical protein
MNYIRLTKTNKKIKISLTQQKIIKDYRAKKMWTFLEKV